MARKRKGQEHPAGQSATPDRQLSEALRAAVSAADILASVARITYRRGHPGVDCPDDQIPSVDQIEAFRADGAMGAACEALMIQAWDVLPTFGPWVFVPLSGLVWPVSIITLYRAIKEAENPAGEAIRQIVTAERVPENAWSANPDSARDMALPHSVSPVPVIQAVHDVWGATHKPPCLLCFDLAEPVSNCQICNGTRYGPPTEPPVKHPLEPLVAGWQRRADPFRLKRRGSLPRFDRTTYQEARLLASSEPSADGSGQFELLRTDDVVDSCATWLLGMFRRAVSMRTGRSLGSTRRGGMPWSFTLTIGGVAHYAIRDRAVWAPDGRDLQFTLETIDDKPGIIDWLHPDGWNNRRRDWHRLDEAFEETPSYRVSVDGIRYSVVSAYGLPVVYSPSAEITLNVRVPPSAAHGARFDWHRYHVTYSKQANLQRALLATAGLLDRTAHNGNPLTRMVLEPALDKDGKPKRERIIGKDGKPKRDKQGRYKTRGVFTGQLVPNPLLGEIQPAILPDRHLALFLGMADKRSNRYDAKAALETLQRDAVIDLERVPNGYRVFGPVPKVKAPR